jgi:hypothetical protein
MNNDENRIKLKDGARCAICGEPVLAPPFVASKPRRGGATIYVHTECLEQEQQEVMT